MKIREVLRAVGYGSPGIPGIVGERAGKAGVTVPEKEQAEPSTATRQLFPGPDAIRQARPPMRESGHGLGSAAVTSRHVFLGRQALVLAQTVTASSRTGLAQR